jgi:hypothetical protein
VPINDSLTEFKLVGVADRRRRPVRHRQRQRAHRQDLQIISGLPPLVREGDRFRPC